MDFFQMFVSKHRHSCCMQYAIRWGVTSWLEKSTCYQHLFGWFRGMSLDRDLCIVFESAKGLFSDHLILSTIPKLTYESITPCILQHGMRCFAWRSYRWMIQKFWDAKCHVFVSQILAFWTLASIKWQGIQSFVKIIHCNANHLFAFCGLGIWSLTGSDLRFSNSGHLGLAGKGVEKRLGSRTVPVASQSSHQTDVRWNQQNTADFGPDGRCLSSEMQRIITDIVWLCRFVAIRIWVWRVQDRKLFTRGPKSTRRHESEVVTRPQVSSVLFNRCFQVDLCQAFWMSRA